jgi:hypothetical protein
MIEPVFEERFINGSFACRVGLGTHATMHYTLSCVQQAKRQWGKYYVLKGDMAEFFLKCENKWA